jgi:probable rRNA maturation factor
LGSRTTCEWTLVLTDNQEVHQLNKQYRKKDKPTDVLSFVSDTPGYLGDVVISVDKAKLQAKEYECSLIDELTRLTVHGLLHLLGYEHEKVSPSVARKMRKMEELLLSQLL